MPCVKSMRETRQGMQNVRDAIVAQLRAREISITTNNFAWNHGREFVGFPDSIHMMIQVGSREVVKSWPHEELVNATARE